MRKSQKLAENSRIEKKETETPRPSNQIVNQVNSGHRDEIIKSQMEQSREKTPEPIYVPQKTYNSNESKSNIQPHTKITRKSDTK